MLRDEVARLNDHQRQAVEHSEGPLLILAGAGSGKTRVLTLRVAHLIAEHAVAPWRMLAVTFTNKAAGELRERVDRMVEGGVGREVWVSTFHSTCLRMLRQDISRIDGFRNDFVVYDDRDSQELVKRILKDMKAPDSVNPRAISAAIDRAKNEAIGPETLRSRPTPDSDPRTPEVYARYQERLKQSNALDFGDLIVHLLHLIENDTAVRQKWQERFRHVLVDEYQDTNHAQYRLVKALCDHGPRNVCVVGDEDQSIYSFRGADIRNILDFERDFPGARTVRLERNYRSTEAILRAATAVVERNLDRKGKTLWTEQSGGEPIRLMSLEDDREEAFAAVETVRHELQMGRAPKDIAVFFRTNGQSRQLEEAFLASRLPFVLVGGQRFYERREVKDALCWLRLLHNPDDDIALLRAVAEPPRGIGEKTLQLVAQQAAAAGGSLWTAARTLVAGSGLTGRARTALAAFLTLVDQLRGIAAAETLPRLVEELFDRTGLVRRHREEGTFEAEGRASNLEELAASTAIYRDAPPGEALPNFLDRVALISDLDTADEGDDRGRITLMTIHAAKGLEWPTVIVTGLDENLFPHARSVAVQSALEEERRLMYVAVTRARERLYLMRARRRPAAGGFGYEETKPSRFLRDIPRELFSGAVAAIGRADPRVSDAPGVAWDRGPSSRRGGAEPSFDSDEPARSVRGPAGLRTPTSALSHGSAPPAARPSPASFLPPAKEPPTLPFGAARSPAAPRESAGTGARTAGVDRAVGGVRVGTRVRHPTFGDGEVQALEGPSDNPRATVFFPRAGQKRIFVKFAGWTVIGGG